MSDREEEEFYDSLFEASLDVARDALLESELDFECPECREEFRVTPGSPCRCPSCGLEVTLVPSF